MEPQQTTSPEPSNTPPDLDNVPGNSAQDNVILADSFTWTNKGLISKTPVNVTLHKTHLKIDRVPQDGNIVTTESIDDIPLDQITKIRQQTGRASAGMFVIETTSKKYVLRFNDLTKKDIIFGSLIIASFMNLPYKQRFKLWKTTIENLQAGGAA